MVDEQQDNFDDSLLDRALEAAFDPALIDDLSLSSKVHDLAQVFLSLSAS